MEQFAPLQFSKKRLLRFCLLFFGVIGAPFGFQPPSYGQVSQASISEFTQIAWETAASQPFNVNEAQGKVVNGKLYTFGGFDSQKSCCTPTNRAHVYDPATNTWAAIAPMPGMNNGTFPGGVTHAGFATDGTDIYFAGGYTSNAAGTGQTFGTREAWKYNVAQNTYVRLPDLPITVSAGQMEFVNGKLHHIAGTNAARTQDLGNHYMLDLSNMAAGWQSRAALPNPRQHAGSAVLHGKIYFIGGQTGHDANLVAKKEVHRYDLGTNSWVQVADLPVPSGATGRGHISSSVVVLGDRIIVIGGETVHSSGRTNMVSAYSASTDSWQGLTPLPQSRFSGVAGTIGGLLFYTGGSSTKTTYKGSPVIATPEPSPGCQFVSNLSCEQLEVSLPYRLTFDAGVANTIADRNGAGTGFTLVDTYSGTRHPEDGSPPVPAVPGYVPSKLAVAFGRLEITTNKGIASTTSNNQLNALGVRVDTRGTLLVETTVINPFNGAQYQQGGLWFGLSDKTFVKMVVMGNKVELRKEVNNVSLTPADHRITGTISNLHLQTVRLRLVVDPAANTVAGFYSTDGTTYNSVGPTLGIAGTGLTGGKAYAGIFTTHRNGSTPITYIFDDFAVRLPNLPPVVSTPLADQVATVGLPFEVEVQGHHVPTFTDPDEDDLTITASLSNGGALPNWLSLVMQDHHYVLRGTPLSTATYSIQVRASDGLASASSIFNLAVQAPPPPPVEETEIKVNFQLASSPTPAGYAADAGLGFAASRGYGWINAVTMQPADLSANMRQRTGTDDIRLRTFCQMQDTRNGQVAGTWEYVVPNGMYKVSVSVGDPNYFDSVHKLNVEGTVAIPEFVPTSQNKYRAETVTVQVQDGKLTVDATGGTNTKINYVIITPMAVQPDQTAPSVEVKLAGKLQSPEIFQDEVTVTIIASDEGGSGLASVEYSLNNGPFVAYTGPFKLSQVGLYSIQAKATDGSSNQTITPVANFRVESPTKSNAYMVVENLDKFPANDRLSFSLVQIPWRRTNADGTFTPYNANHNRVTVRISNRGSGVLLIHDLALSNSGAWKIAQLGGIDYNSAAALPITVNSRSSVEAVVEFIAVDQATRVKVLNDTLTISSNDDLAPIKKINLHGLWQGRGEGRYEPYAQEIISAFGFKTKVGFSNTDPAKGDPSQLKGDEILSSYFVRADQAKPVYVRQMAAYHGCCSSSETFRWHVKGTTTKTAVFTHIGLDGQSLLPRRNTTQNAPAEGSFNPTGPFGVVINKDWTDRSLNPGQVIGVRVWRAIDAAGNIIPNTYIMGNDYLGTDATNYDYNDNIYYITNIRPEDGPSFYSALAAGTEAIDFGSVLAGGSKSVSLGLSNLGQIYGAGLSDPAIQINKVEIVGPDQGEFFVGALSPITLAASALGSVSVRFGPSGSGIKNAALLVHYNSSLSPLRVPLYGVADDAQLTISALKRIKSAADAGVTIGGKEWEADLPFRKGSLKLDLTVPNPIAGTNDDALYQSYLSAAADLAETRYEIPVPNGTYMVRLHFVENYFTTIGSRVFSVTMENVLRLNNFDIMREVGHKTALVKDFEVSVDDGILHIKFNPTANRLAIAGVEIFQATPNGMVASSVSSTNSEKDGLFITADHRAKLSAYPNPVDQGKVTFGLENFGKGETLSLTIHDVAGRLLHSRTILTDNLGSVDLVWEVDQTVARGLKIVRVHSPSQTKWLKLMVY